MACFDDIGGPLPAWRRRHTDTTKMGAFVCKREPMMSAQFAMGFAMSFLRAAPLVAFAVIVGSPLPALAAKCKSSGGLTYLGNTRDGSRSVWLSLTRQGSFALEAAQGNQTVDTWGSPRIGDCTSRPRQWCQTAMAVPTNSTKPVMTSPALWTRTTRSVTGLFRQTFFRLKG